MASIDDFFAGEPDEFNHPRLREWKRWLTEKEGRSAKLQVYRPPATLGLSPTRMLVRFYQDDAPWTHEEFDWDDYLNRGLIQLKIRALNPEQEAERFALGLRDGFRSIEKEFGNGYFNAVLLDIIADSKPDQYPEIANVLKFVYHDQTDHTSRSYARCRDAIAIGISARAKELKSLPGYTQEEAKTILARAIAAYLDERFSVTSRRQLGLLT